MTFLNTTEMHIGVLPEQERQLSDPRKIAWACKQENVFAFDILDGADLIGFAMLRRFASDSFFLWDYAIDYHFQNRGFGTKALKELIIFLQDEFGLRVMTTTYVFGNEQAKHMYESIGFVETDVVDEPGCHEVNMSFEVLP